MQKKWQIVSLAVSILFSATHSYASGTQKDNGVYRHIIASGSYYSNFSHGYRPLLIDGISLNEWKFSHDIYAHAPEDIANDASFTSTSCTENFCVAVGSFENKNLAQRPLLAISASPINWTYIPTLAPLYSEGKLNSVNCNTSSCIAVGYGLNKSSHYVPILITSNNGMFWSSPDSIVNNLPASVDSAQLINSTCDENGCIAVGSYKNGEFTLPLVAVSSDQGKTWNYSMNFLAKKFNIHNVLLKKVSCDNNFCVIGGTFEGADNLHLPFLAVSNDKGQNWFYPESILTNMPDGIHSADIRDLTFHNNACMVIGYIDDQGYPLLAISKDKGVTWTYQDSVIQRGSKSGFDAVSCYGDMCVAAGNKVVGSITQPFAAVSMDKGESWAYDSMEGLPTEGKITGVACNKDVCEMIGSQKGQNGNDLLILFARNYQGRGNRWSQAQLNNPWVDYESGYLTNITSAVY